jgi:hypothetical protein
MVMTMNLSFRRIKDTVKDIYVKYWFSLVKMEINLLKRVMLHLLKVRNIDPNKKTETEVDKLCKEISYALNAARSIHSTSMPIHIQEKIISFHEKVHTENRDRKLGKNSTEEVSNIKEGDSLEV